MISQTQPKGNFLPSLKQLLSSSPNNETKSTLQLREQTHDPTIASRIVMRNTKNSTSHCKPPTHVNIRHNWIQHELNNTHQLCDPFAETTTSDTLALHRTDSNTSPSQTMDIAAVSTANAVPNTLANSAPHQTNAVTTVDRRINKKDQARRHLVEGLSAPHHKDNGRRLIRSNTFNIPSGSPMSQVKAQRTLNNKNRDVDQAFKNNNRTRLRNSYGGSCSKDDSSKVKKAIENWNELVLELQSDQYRRLSSYDDPFPFDSDSTSEDEGYSHFHKSRLHKSMYAPHSILPGPKHIPSTHKTMTSNTISDQNMSADSQGFGKYRPITPNLLLEMEKNKLSSKKKTQRWINQLEVQNRSQAVSTSINTTMPAITKEIGDERKTQTPKEGELSRHRGDRKLHRTESYGSNRTRQSGVFLGDGGAKQLSGFL